MKKFDLIVVGGGLTGTAAAVSAAREGLSVLLIEQSGSLGGAISTNLVFPFMRYWTDMENAERKWLSAGIFTEMCRRANAYAPAQLPTDYSTEAFQFALDDMTGEAGVQVLFHGTLFGVKTSGRKVLDILCILQDIV